MDRKVKLTVAKIMWKIQNSNPDPRMHAVSCTLQQSVLTTRTDDPELGVGVEVGLRMCDA